MIITACHTAKPLIRGYVVGGICCVVGFRNKFIKKKCINGSVYLECIYPMVRRRTNLSINMNRCSPDDTVANTVRWRMMRRKRIAPSWGDGLVNDPREKNLSRWWRDTRCYNNKLSCFDHTFDDEEEFDSFLYTINPHRITRENYHLPPAKKRRVYKDM